jgi:hypothetical protein
MMQNYWVGVSTPLFQELIGWRLYPMHAFFCALSFVLGESYLCVGLICQCTFCILRRAGYPLRRWTSKSFSLSSPKASADDLLGYSEMVSIRRVPCDPADAQQSWSTKTISKMTATKTMMVPGPTRPLSQMGGVGPEALALPLYQHRTSMRLYVKMRMIHQCSNE